jgi:hypothetical protein
MNLNTFRYLAIFINTIRMSLVGGVTLYSLAYGLTIIGIFASVRVVVGEAGVIAIASLMEGGVILGMGSYKLKFILKILILN